MTATNSGCAAGAGVLPCAPMDLPRGPCLLAFCAAPPRFEEAFRAELRGLGAPLLALTPSTGTLFGADDEPRTVGRLPSRSIRPPSSASISSAGMGDSRAAQINVESAQTVSSSAATNRSRARRTAASVSIASG